MPLVVTTCPRKPFSKRELEALGAFVRGGRGSLLVCLEEGGEEPLGQCHVCVEACMWA